MCVLNFYSILSILLFAKAVYFFLCSHKCTLFFVFFITKKARSLNNNNSQMDFKQRFEHTTTMEQHYCFLCQFFFSLLSRLMRIKELFCCFAVKKKKKKMNDNFFFCWNEFRKFLLKKPKWGRKLFGGIRHKRRLKKNSGHDRATINYLWTVLSIKCVAPNKFVLIRNDNNS